MFIYTGTKISGDGRGKKLGFPTINLDVETNCNLSLQEGVFAGKIFSSENTKKNIKKNKKFSCLIHIGPRPTFDSEEFRVEIFVLEDSRLRGNDGKNFFDQKNFSFEILKKIRDIQKFSSSKKLVERIELDRKIAIKFLEK